MSCTLWAARQDFLKMVTAIHCCARPHKRNIPSPTPTMSTLKSLTALPKTSNSATLLARQDLNITYKLTQIIFC